MATTPKRKSPAGFFILALLNVVSLILINLHGWWRPFTRGIVTARFSEVVWAASLSAVLLIIGNLLLMRWSTRVASARINFVLEGGKLLSALVILAEFPFDLERFGAWAPTGGRVFLVVAALVSVASMAANLLRLIRFDFAHSRRVTTDDGVLKARVIYESIFGNTRDVALAVAKGMQRVPHVEVEVSEVGQAGVSDCGLLVVGGPVHAWSMTRNLTRTGAREQASKAGRDPVSHGIGVREYVDHLPPAKHVAAATFDTAASTKWFPVGSAARPAARTLDALGYDLVAKPEHFYVKDVMGPLLQGELARAEEWGAALAQRCVS